MNQKDPCSSVFVMFQSLASIYRQNYFFCKSKEISTSVALTLAKYSSPSVF